MPLFLSENDDLKQISSFFFVCSRSFATIVAEYTTLAYLQSFQPHRILFFSPSQAKTKLEFDQIIQDPSGKQVLDSFTFRVSLDEKPPR